MGKAAWVLGIHAGNPDCLRKQVYGALGFKYGKGGVGAGSAQSGGTAGRGADVEAGIRELRRRRADADAARHDHGRTGPVVRRAYPIL